MERLRRKDLGKKTGDTTRSKNDSLESFDQQVRDQAEKTLERFVYLNKRSFVNWKGQESF